MDFHARFCSVGKKYQYLILNSLQPSAVFRNRAYHVRLKLNIEAMKEATKYFIGQNDFSSFYKAGGSNVKTTVRTIESISLTDDNFFTGISQLKACKDMHMLRLEIVGNGFLHNMVRIIAGTLVDVGTGKISPAQIPLIMDTKDRKKAGKTAGAHGLYLLEVIY